MVEGTRLLKVFGMFSYVMSGCAGRKPAPFSRVEVTLDDAVEAESGHSVGTQGRQTKDWHRGFESASLRQAVCNLWHSREKLAKFARVRGFPQS